MRPKSPLPPPVHVRTRPPYPVYAGPGLLARLPGLMASRFEGRRCVLVSDPWLRPRLAARASSALRRAGWEVRSVTLPRGEAAKSFAALRRLYAAFGRAGVERRTPIVALGGGAVGDAAGFAAATWYRGLPLVQVPTTLLAQVDSAIGGKTAVNLPGAKNAVGAFHQPSLVVADADALGTLSRRDFLAGMGEVVKYALVFDPGFARRLDLRWESLLRRDPDELGFVVRRCAALKARVVAADERDLSGRRELLNFGHTLGHALEAASGYGRFRHGEAVAWGMRAAVELSRGRGFLRAGSDAIAGGLLARLPAVSLPRGVTPSRLLPLLKRDKKARGGRAVFVLLEAVGRPRRAADVTDAEIRAALARLAGRKR